MNQIKNQLQDKLKDKKTLAGLIGAIVLIPVAILLIALCTGPGDAGTRFKAFTGNADAQMTLSRTAFLAQEDAYDEEAGAYWAERAAKNGDQIAAGLVGVLYMGGIGVKQDFIKAQEWLSKSPDPQAQQQAAALGELNTSIAALPKEMRREKERENYSRAQEHIRESFAQIIAAQARLNAAQQQQQSSVE